MGAWKPSPLRRCWMPRWVSTCSMYASFGSAVRLHSLIHSVLVGAVTPAVLARPRRCCRAVQLSNFQIAHGGSGYYRSVSIAAGRRFVVPHNGSRPASTSGQPMTQAATKLLYAHFAERMRHVGAG